jgi:HD-GYP domain-containing protein (c-di-GMP phosphodiesterase class II)
LRSLIAIVRHHHEFYNGQGYPDGLSGYKIPIEARIVSVADAIEAMASDRPYRKARKTQYIIDEIKKYSGTQFDPNAVEQAVILLEAKNKKEESTTPVETFFALQVKGNSES